MSVEPDELVERLRRIGLEDDAAAVYVHLIRLGPCKASDVAAAARLSRPEAYRALDHLVQLGYAASSISRPARYEASAAEEVFRQLRASAETRSDELRAAEEQVQNLLEEIRQQPVDSLRKTRFNLLHGWDALVRRLGRMFHESKQEFRVLLTVPKVSSLLSHHGGWERLAGRMHNSMTVHALTPPNLRPHLQGPHLNLEVRSIAAATPMALFIADAGQCLVLATGQPDTRLHDQDVVSVWTDAPTFVRTQREFFDALWAQAQAETRGAVEESIAGSPTFARPRW